MAEAHAADVLASYRQGIEGGDATFETFWIGVAKPSRVRSPGLPVDQ